MLEGKNVIDIIALLSRLLFSYHSGYDGRRIRDLIKKFCICQCDTVQCLNYKFCNKHHFSKRRKKSESKELEKCSCNFILEKYHFLLYIRRGIRKYLQLINTDLYSRLKK